MCRPSGWAAAWRHGGAEGFWILGRFRGQGDFTLHRILPVPRTSDPWLLPSRSLSNLKVIRARMKRFLLIAAAALYILSPIDLIPDIVPVAGWADDLVVLLLALNQGRQLLRGERRSTVIPTTRAQPR
ncbi:hypothetical protein VT03_20545 [Planctomyces sp. SH-PL14]|nr:hypothetical protein VT03_20545 [Planctomyces sp. SH-PL14]